MSHEADTGNDLAILCGALVGVLCYTCAVLGCVKIYQCDWLLDEWDDNAPDDDDDAPNGRQLNNALLPATETSDAGQEEDVIFEQGGPQNV